MTWFKIVRGSECTIKQRESNLLGAIENGQKNLI